MSTQSSMKDGKNSFLPGTLIQLVKYMFKGIKSRFGKEAMRIFIISGIIFVILFVVNLYLIIVVNEGFGTPDPAAPYYNLIPAEGAFFRTTSFWLVVISIIFTTIYRIKYGGLGRFLKDLVQTPKWISRCVENAGESWKFTLLISICVSLLIGIIVENNYAIFALAVLLFLSFTAQLRSGLLYVVILTRMDLRRLFRGKKEIKPIKVGAAAFGIFSASAGFIISWLLPFKPVSSMIVIAAVIICMFLLRTKKINTSTTVFLLSFIIFNLILMRFGRAFADDGGWSEGGGTLWDWSRSEGAGRAVRKAAEPSVASAFWSMFAGFFSSIAEFVLNIPGHSAPAGPGTMDTLKYGYDIAAAGSPEAAQRAAAKGIYDLIGPPGMGDTMNPMVDAMLNFPNMNF